MKKTLLVLSLSCVSVLSACTSASLSSSTGTSSAASSTAASSLASSDSFSYNGVPVANAAAREDDPATVSSLDQLTVVQAAEDPLVERTAKGVVSASTVEIYKTFAQNFVTAALASAKANESFNISILDAFMNLGIDANLSKGTGQTNILSFFGKHTLSEVNAAAKEIRSTLGILKAADDEHTDQGTFLIDALFFGRDLAIDEERSDIATALAENYGVSIYHNDPNPTNVNLYIAGKTPSSYFSPQLLPGLDSDGARKQAMSLSSFDYLGRFGTKIAKYNEAAYQKNLQNISFTSLDGTTTSVPYGLDGLIGNIYTTDDFVGYDSSCGMTFFKMSGSKTPFEVLPSILSGDYFQKAKVYQTLAYLPYFKSDSAMVLPTLGTYEDGVFAAFVKKIDSGDCFVTEQENKLTFNYDGVAESSLTYTTNYTSSSKVYDSYTFKLDHSFSYRQDLPAVLADGTASHLPIFLGVVATPNYTE